MLPQFGFRCLWWVECPPSPARAPVRWAACACLHLMLLFVHYALMHKKQHQTHARGHVLPSFEARLRACKTLTILPLLRLRLRPICPRPTAPCALLLSAVALGGTLRTCIAVPSPSLFPRQRVTSSVLSGGAAALMQKPRRWRLTSAILLVRTREAVQHRRSCLNVVMVSATMSSSTAVGAPLTTARSLSSSVTLETPGLTMSRVIPTTRSWLTVQLRTSRGCVSPAPLSLRLPSLAHVSLYVIGPSNLPPSRALPCIITAGFALASLSRADCEVQNFRTQFCVCNEIVKVRATRVSFPHSTWMRVSIRLALKLTACVSLSFQRAGERCSMCDCVTGRCQAAQGSKPARCLREVGWGRACQNRRSQPCHPF